MMNCVVFWFQKCEVKVPEKSTKSYEEKKHPGCLSDMGFGSLTNALSGSRGSPPVTCIYIVDLSYTLFFPLYT